MRCYVTILGNEKSSGIFILLGAEKHIDCCLIQQVTTEAYSIDEPRLCSNGFHFELF